MNKQNYEIHDSNNTVELDKENHGNTFDKTKQEKNLGMSEIPMEKEFKKSAIGPDNSNENNLNNQLNNQGLADSPENQNNINASNYETLDESVWETLVLNI